MKSLKELFSRGKEQGTDTTLRTNLMHIEKEIENLSRLVDINRIINATLDIRQLLTVIMEIIKEIMHTEASTMLLYDEESRDLVFKVALGEAGESLTEKYRVKIGQGIAGWVAENREYLLVNDVYNDPRFDPAFDKQTGFTTTSILCTPLLFKGKLLGVIQAINPLLRQGFNEKDVKLFQIFADQAALAVQNAIFFQNALEEERIRTEISTATELQKSLAGEEDRALKGIEVAQRSLAAREIGGSFHRLFEVSPHETALLAGDARLKGVPGGMRAALISGAVTGLAAGNVTDPGEVLSKLQESFKSEEEMMRQLSLFYGVYNAGEGLLKFVHIGTVHLFLVRGEKVRYIKPSDENDALTGSKTLKVALKENDYFVIVNDGYFRIRNRLANTITVPRVQELLKGDYVDPWEMTDSMIEEVENFADGLDLRWDIAITSALIKQ